ncbi:MAG TPA: galactokinase family protein [Armatimonadota bacterium]|nr:galactokinase family protein [Armatimonadota bacterium]
MSCVWPVGEWIRRFEDPRAWRRVLRGIYGSDETLLEDRRQAWLAVLRRHARDGGTGAPALLARSPSRVNVMGVHIDHRKGEVNYMTHRRETLMVATPRADDVVRLRNMRADTFPPREFSITEALGPRPWPDWVTLIESPHVADQVRESQGDWQNYVKAAVLRLQHFASDHPLHGLDLTVWGDIPMAAGLSSSSALVVATAIAAVAANGLDIAPAHLVDLCGEGEWLVGTRGGAGDHSAMIFGRRGLIAHVGFFPCRLLRYVPAPAGCDVVLCNSLRMAAKSAAELSAYNATIAAYGAALLVLKQVLVKDLGVDPSRLDDEIEHLGDFRLHARRYPDALLYRALKQIPERLSRAQLLERLPESREALERMFRTHDAPPEGYRVRAVAMFGLAEIARGAGCVEMLRHGDMRGFGELMYISHDGDRVVVHDDAGRVRPWDNERSRVSDAYLDGLVADLEGEDRACAMRAELMWQPGGYGCSCEELDALVDICKRQPGVYGAGLTGAGLGGCVLALVAREQTPFLLAVLEKEYYTARGLPMAAEPCVSVEGAGVVRTD